MQRVLLLVLLLFIFVGCGYKPLAHAAKQKFGKNVSSEIVISMQDPENSVDIKDALDEAVLKVFHLNLVEESKAKTHLKIDLKSIYITPITYDINGFISRYQIKVTLMVELNKIGEDGERRSKIFHTTGYHILKSEIISDVERYNAINKASEKALDSFVHSALIEGELDEN